MAHVQYEDHLHDHDRWLTLPGYPLEPDFPEEEYQLRINRARQLMSEAETRCASDHVECSWAVVHIGHGTSRMA